MKVKSLSRVQLFATPWTVAYQVPLFMDLPGENAGVGCHSPGDLPDPRIESESPARQVVG